MTMDSSTPNDDKLLIADEYCLSSAMPPPAPGGAPSLDVLDHAIAASGTALVTVAMRRIEPSARGSLLDVITGRGVRILPNTSPAGCFYRQGRRS